jgi:hypothetical protein
MNYTCIISIAISIGETRISRRERTGTLYKEKKINKNYFFFLFTFKTNGKEFSVIKIVRFMNWSAAVV